MRVCLHDRFWRAVMLFAYRRLRHHGAGVPTGIPGHRDPEAPCTGYCPRPKPGLAGLDCHGDGHYLCRECANLCSSVVEGIEQ